MRRAIRPRSLRSQHSGVRSRSWGGRKAAISGSNFAGAVGDADRIKTFAKELVDLRPDAILSQTTPVTGVLINGGPAFKHNEAFSFQIATDDQQETDRYWNATPEDTLKYHE